MGKIYSGESTIKNLSDGLRFFNMKLIQQIASLAGLTPWGQYVCFPIIANPLPAPAFIEWDCRCPYFIAPELTYIGHRDDIVFPAFQRLVDSLNSETFWTPLQARDEQHLVSRLDSGECSNEHATVLPSVKVSISDLGAELQYNVDESYSLEINEEIGIRIQAGTRFGALHALTTLEQLILKLKNGKYVIEQGVTIRDKPLYSHRGVSVDTARNFYPIETLLRQIDAMAMAKMNVLHWHMVDSESWPLALESLPEMSQAAFSEAEQYTPSDIKKIVRYAYQRGVRIIPEIDLPGHASLAWKYADPNAVICDDLSYFDPPIGFVGPQLDVTYDGTYKLLEAVYNELSQLFPDHHFHVGFDEMWTKCTDLNEKMQRWLIDNNYTYADIGQYYVNQSMPIFKSVPNRTIVMWEDAVLGHTITAKDLPKDIVLQAWDGGIKSAKKLANMGYDVIISAYDFLYLDCGKGQAMAGDPRYLQQKDPDPSRKEFSFNYRGDGGSWCAPYKTWQRLYSLDFHHTMTEVELSHVVGAEAAVWSEQIDDMELDAIIWPRTGSLAELLWSGNRDNEGYHRVSEFFPRLLYFRERLKSKGLRPASIGSRLCLRDPQKCDLGLVGKNHRDLPSARD
jgi:hexosaminidase